jgi:hypothetical protein
MKIDWQFRQLQRCHDLAATMPCGYLDETEAHTNILSTEGP